MSSPSGPRVPASLTQDPRFTASPALQGVWNGSQNVSLRVQRLSVGPTVSLGTMRVPRDSCPQPCTPPLFGQGNRKGLSLDEGPWASLNFSKLSLHKG